MNKSLLTTLTGAVLLSFSSLASAGVVTDNVNVNVIVDAGCTLHPAADHTVELTDGTLSAVETRNFAVTCNDQLPYTLSIGTLAGGKLVVTDAGTSKSYDVFFKNGAAGDIAWGTKANGEEYIGTGNGQTQLLPYRLEVNKDEAYGRMQVGSYKGVVTRTLEWAP